MASRGAVRSINYALQCIERRDGGNINKPFFFILLFLCLHRAPGVMVVPSVVLAFIKI